MARGEVRELDMEVPDRSNPPWSTTIVSKYAVQLQHDGTSAFDNSERVAVVLVSTDDEPTREPNDWEAKIDGHHGLSRPSIIDGRWVFTIDRRFFEAGRLVTVFDPSVMDDIAQAVFVGLDLKDI